MKLRLKFCDVCDRDTIRVWVHQKWGGTEFSPGGEVKYWYCPTCGSEFYKETSTKIKTRKQTEANPLEQKDGNDIVIEIARLAVALWKSLKKE